jgi:hypothetical protein
VYQWVHSSPTTLYFDGYDQYQTLDVNQITDMGVRGSFFNLFDCSASRYTEENLAEMYLHQTYGLATIGSTKAGGIYSPWVFHDVLASGGTWGEGYIRWYEAEGRRDDSWFLGIVVMGDPTLTLSNDTRRAMGAATRPTAALSAEQMQDLSDTMVRFQHDAGSFEAYREAFPQYH